MKDLKSFLKNTDFLYLWNSQILSQMTINIMNFLLLVRMFQYTGSTIATSLLWVAYALPALIVGPFAAAAVDMVDRRKVLMITNLLQSVVIFSYAFIYEKHVFLPYGIVILYSFFNQFYLPAEAASVPTLVKKKHLPQANGLFFITQNAAIILGFGMAGLLSQGLGFDKTLYLCSILLFLAFVSVSFLPKMKPTEEMPDSFEESFFTFFKRIAEGYKFIKGNRTVLAPFLLLLAFFVGAYIIAVNVPLIAEELLGVDVNSAGIMVVVPAGIGALLGAILVPRALKKGVRKKKVVDTSLLILMLSIFSMVFVIPELINPYNLVVSSITIMFVAIGFIGILIPSQTIIQEVTPGGLRGRVFGNFWFLATVATILPVLFSGAISEIFGIRTLLLILCLIVFVIFIFSKKKGDTFIRNGFSIKTNE